MFNKINTYRDDILNYCKVNNIEDVDLFVTKCFKQGFDIQKYGMLGETNEVKEIIKEVEKIVETVKEVEVIKYVDREVVKEVPIEKVVERIVKISDDTQINELLLKIQQLESRPPEIFEVVKEVPIEKEVIKEVIKEVPVEVSEDKSKLLQTTLLNLRKELSLKNEKIKELEEKIKNLESIKINQGAVFMKVSNLTQNL